MSGRNSECYSLNAGQNEGFRTWLDKNIDSFTPENYGDMIANFFDCNLRENPVSSKNRFSPNNLFPNVNRKQIYALRIMQDEIKEQIEALPDSDEDASIRAARALSRVKRHFSMEWYDVLGSRTYQLLLKYLAVEGGISINVSMLYDFNPTSHVAAHSPSCEQSLSFIAAYYLLH